MPSWQRLVRGGKRGAAAAAAAAAAVPTAHARPSQVTMEAALKELATAAQPAAAHLASAGADNSTVGAGWLAQEQRRGCCRQRVTAAVPFRSARPGSPLRCMRVFPRGPVLLLLHPPTPPTAG